MRYAFIFEQKKAYPITVLCRVMQVSRSGFHAFLKRQRCPARQPTTLTRDAREIFKQSRRSYGSRRLCDALRARGHRIGRYAVRHLMHRLRLEVARRPPFRVTTNSRHKLPVAANLLNRHFRVKEPNQVWGSDITYLRTDEGWLYLAVVMDLHSRKVVGWAMNHYMGTDLAIRALEMACQYRRPEAGLLHHSDRGVQYASRRYQAYLNEWGMVCSMSRKGDCWDNAVVERFFRSLKMERVSHQCYSTRKAARADVLDYITMFYNSRRLHSYLGNRSPNDYEAAASKAA